MPTRPALAEPGTAERQVAGLDPRDHRVGLLARQPAVLDGLLDAVDERLLEGGGELVGSDPELLGRIVDDCLLLFLGCRLVGRDRGAGSGQACNDEAGDDDVSLEFHASHPRMTPLNQTLLCPP